MKNNIKIITEILKKEGVKKALLFGSSINNKNFRDFDIAIDKYPKKEFFKIYGELIMRLNKPVDLVDLTNIRKNNRRFHKLLLNNSKTLI